MPFRSIVIHSASQCHLWRTHTTDLSYLATGFPEVTNQPDTFVERRRQLCCLRFETGTSCGLNKREVRERWERDLFQGGWLCERFFSLESTRTFMSCDLIVQNVECRRVSN